VAFLKGVSFATGLMVAILVAVLAITAVIYNIADDSPPKCTDGSFQNEECILVIETN